MRSDGNKDSELFDDWPDRYTRWFATPIGSLVKRYESELLKEMLNPKRGELLLDVGCGTGIFTDEILASDARVIGMDISRPMLISAVRRFSECLFSPLAGNMLHLPFANGSFDKVYSMTAIEFVDNAQAAIAELQRVTMTGGSIVLTTLNSLSPWAVQRRKKASKGHRLFKNMIFRSPDEMRGLVPAGAIIKTAIHFQKDDPPGRAMEIEEEMGGSDKETGAFLAVSWKNI